MKAKVVIFQNKKEAEAETGFFSVSSMMITTSLAKKITRFIERESLRTWAASKSHHTRQDTSSDTIYTLKFKLSCYKYPDKKTAYLSDGGARGTYKSGMKEKSVLIHSRSGTPREFVHQPEKQTLRTFGALYERTPTFETMYFWIAQKYPQDILWMEYRLKPITFGSSAEINVDNIEF